MALADGRVPGIDGGRCVLRNEETADGDGVSRAA